MSTTFKTGGCRRQKTRAVKVAELEVCSAGQAVAYGTTGHAHAQRLVDEGEVHPALPSEYGALLGVWNSAVPAKQALRHGQISYPST